MDKALKQALHVGAQPLTLNQWQQLLEEAGFSIQKSHQAQMLLMEPQRMIQDEGLCGALKFVARVITTPAARRRLWKIRKTFKYYSGHINATALIAVKPA
jgi:hypothetical protein